VRALSHVGHPRQTKLICTIGPASAEHVDGLVDAGMDIARLNFSHGTQEARRLIVDRVRTAAGRTGREVDILADLPGPKIRLGELPGGRICLGEGTRFTLVCSGPCPDGLAAPVDHPGLAGDVRPGDTVFLADGAVELRVIGSPDGIHVVVCDVVRGGVVRSRAGVNIPSVPLSLPALSDRDCAGLASALELGAEVVAQSFVRQAEDVRRLRERAGTAGGWAPRIFAKIETLGAVEDAEAILRAADGIIVARGDLGVELPFDQIPMVQKDLIGRARAAGIPCVVATQMLSSMVGSPRPTRAEVGDVANAVLDGADGILLSEETAIGSYPVAAAETAARVLATTERWAAYGAQEGAAGFGQRFGPLDARRLA
jgi:pyruvate kinase